MERRPGSAEQVLGPVPTVAGVQQEEGDFLVLCSERVPSSPGPLKDSSAFSKA